MKLFYVYVYCCDNINADFGCAADSCARLLEKPVLHPSKTRLNEVCYQFTDIREWNAQPITEDSNQGHRFGVDMIVEVPSYHAICTKLHERFNARQGA